MAEHERGRHQTHQDRQQQGPIGADCGAGGQQQLCGGRKGVALTEKRFKLGHQHGQCHHDHCDTHHQKDNGVDQRADHL